MKILIFGDVHGNLPALEKLFKKEDKNYDLAICHGDVVNYGPWSNECVDLLADLPKTVCLKGNHEAAFLSGTYPGENEIAKSFFLQCFPVFSREKSIEFYREEVELKDYVVRHTLNNSYIYPDTDLSEVGLDQNYIIGHSHYAFHRTFNKRCLVNTGSLGQDRKFINRANYIIYNEEKNQIDMKSFTFDLDLVLAEMKIKNYPEICLNYYRNKRTI